MFRATGGSRRTTGWAALPRARAAPRPVREPVRRTMAAAAAAALLIGRPRRRRAPGVPQLVTGPLMEANVE